MPGTFTDGKTVQPRRHGDHGDRSEIQTHSQTNLARAHGPRGDEEIIYEVLAGDGIGRRGEGVEVDELAAKAEHGLVQNVVEFRHRPQTYTLAQLKLARRIQIKNKLPRTAAGITR